MSAPTALVTGATSGIGLHIARQLAEQGWTVLVGARDADRGAEVAAQVGGRPLLLDVTDADTIASAAATVPRLDVLVNNAGISLDIGTPVTNTDVDVFRRTYETNVFGVVAVTNAFLPALRRSAHPRIVNVSSGTGSLTWSTGPNPQFDYPGPVRARVPPTAPQRPPSTRSPSSTRTRSPTTASRSTPSRPVCEPRISTPRPRPAATQPKPRRAPSGSHCCRTMAPPASCSPGTGRSCRGEIARGRVAMTSVETGPPRR